MAHWVEHLGATGRTEYLFELEMWLRSFERYFRIRNQPISEDSARMLAIRSFYEEIGLVANGIQRVTELCTLLSSEDQVSQERFDKYVENYLKKDEIADPYVARLLRQKSPTAGLTLLRESLEDVKLVLTELTKLSRIPFATFQSVGRILYREIYRNDYLALLLDQRFKPAYDRITAEPISELIRRMENPDEKRLVARVFLHFFRLLHYLEYADPRRRHMEDLRTTVLVFSLVASETRSALDFLQRQRSSLAQGSPFADVLDSFDYCIPLELRKVINTELIDVTAFKQPDAVYMRIENSHGILRDCFQQSVIQLAKGFDPTIEGQQIFDHFATRLEHSLQLREDLLNLLAAVRSFARERDDESAELMKKLVSRFCDKSLRFLMYRDWSTFESFTVEIRRCDSHSGLLQVGHRFDTYVQTLLREIGKRSVFAGRSGGEEPIPSMTETTE